MQTRRVVVTGLGAITPIGNTLEAYWDGLLKGVSGANLITHFDASKFKTQFACEVKGFEPTDFIDKKEVRKMDRFTQMAIVASDEAIKNSSLDLEKENKDRIGVIWGAGIGGLMTFQEEVLAFGKGDGTPRFNPFFIPNSSLLLHAIAQLLCFQCERFCCLFRAFYIFVNLRAGSNTILKRILRVAATWIVVLDAYIQSISFRLLALAFKDKASLNEIFRREGLVIGFISSFFQVLHTIVKLFVSDVGIA